jgi:hypothetical protein
MSFEFEYLGEIEAVIYLALTNEAKDRWNFLLKGNNSERKNLVSVSLEKEGVSA